MRKKLAIFASGAGSNAQKIIDHFRESHKAEVAVIICNKPNAGVLAIAEKEGIEAVLTNKEQYKKDGYAAFLKKKGIDFIILAGFLLKIPHSLIDAYPQKIINIHPALLPKYGGKGKYGSFLPEGGGKKKKKKKDTNIHYVDEHYDHGAVIFQATCEVSADDTSDTLAQKIHKLEHAHFPAIVERIIDL